jgi:hypothetical protein
VVQVSTPRPAPPDAASNAKVGTRSADLPSASHPQASSARAVAGVWPLCRELARAVVHRSDSGGRRRNAESPTQRPHGLLTETRSERWVFCVLTVAFRVCTVYDTACMMSAARRISKPRLWADGCGWPTVGKVLVSYFRTGGELGSRPNGCTPAALSLGNLGLRIVRAMDTPYCI